MKWGGVGGVCVCVCACARVCVSAAAESLHWHVLMGTVCCAGAASTRRRWGTGAGGRGRLGGRGRGCLRRRLGCPWGLLPLLQKSSASSLGTTTRGPFAPGPDPGASRQQSCPPAPPRLHTWAVKRGVWRGHAHNPARGTRAILPLLEHPETLPGLSPGKDSLPDDPSSPGAQEVPGWHPRVRRGQGVGSPPVSAQVPPTSCVEKGWGDGGRDFP